MPTTVESRVAMPEPRTAAAMTQRPRADLYASPSGASLSLGADAITPEGRAFLVQVTTAGRPPATVDRPALLTVLRVLRVPGGPAHPAGKP